MHTQSGFYLPIHTYSYQLVMADFIKTLQGGDP